MRKGIFSLITIGIVSLSMVERSFADSDFACRAWVGNISQAIDANIKQRINDQLKSKLALELQSGGEVIESFQWVEVIPESATQRSYMYKVTTKSGQVANYKLAVFLADIGTYNAGFNYVFDIVGKMKFQPNASLATALVCSGSKYLNSTAKFYNADTEVYIGTLNIPSMENFPYNAAVAEFYGEYTYEL